MAALEIGVASAWQRHNNDANETPRVKAAGGQMNPVLRAKALGQQCQKVKEKQALGSRCKSQSRVWFHYFSL